MNNYNEMFLPLYKNDILNLDGINEEKINKLSFTKLLDIYDEVSQSVAKLPNRDELSGRVFTSSNSLSGSSLECEELSCRIKRVDELAKFSSLFADQVLWHNFLSDISPSFGHPPETDSEDFRYHVLADIHVLFKIKDLIDNNIIQPYTIPHGYCPDCFAKTFYGDRNPEQILNAKLNLENDIKNSLSLSISCLDEDLFTINYDGDDNYIPHGGASIMYNRNEIESIIPNHIIDKIKENQKIKLPDKVYNNLNIPAHLSNSLTTEALYQKTIANITGSSILTHSTGEINAIKRIEGNDYIRNINNLLLNHWDIIIPFANNFTPTEILELRFREQESFISFRSCLDKSLSEAFAMKETFTSKDARDIYASIIQPSLAELDKKAKSAARSLFKKPLFTATSVVATLSLGAASGLLSHDLATALKLLGASKITYDTINELLHNCNLENSIKNENYYFLWKMRKLA